NLWLSVSKRVMLTGLLAITNQFNFGDIDTNDEWLRWHCHQLSSHAMVFRLGGVHQEALTCSYRRLQTMHSLSALW
ncbi:hypothetical protein, partial [Phytopseudomonas straminea]|uniref:hypothetical protein n=1 Tax=Pseudomonas straminea TaxID=47882 RepID=UPI001ABF4CBF